MKLDAKIPEGPIEEKWSIISFQMKLVNPANKRKYNVIVVGTGLAGASAAATMEQFHSMYKHSASRTHHGELIQLQLRNWHQRCKELSRRW